MFCDGVGSSDVACFTTGVYPNPNPTQPNPRSRYCIQPEDSSTTCGKGAIKLLTKDEGESNWMAPRTGCGMKTSRQGRSPKDNNGNHEVILKCCIHSLSASRCYETQSGLKFPPVRATQAGGHHLLFSLIHHKPLRRLSFAETPADHDRVEKEQPALAGCAREL